MHECHQPSVYMHSLIMYLTIYIRNVLIIIVDMILLVVNDEMLSTQMTAALW